MTKRFKHGDKLLTAAEARKRYPSPNFLYRATERMGREEVEAIVLRNVSEIRFWLDQWEKFAKGQYAGRLPKRMLVTEANLMHDWRVGMNIISGELGRPYLWEE